MTLHSIVSHIKEIEVNDWVSYGRVFMVGNTRKIVIIPIGFSDGYGEKM